MLIFRTLIRLCAISSILVIFIAQPADAARRQSGHAEQATPTIYVGDRKIRTPALVDRGRLLVPVRGVFEAIGANVQFSWPNFVVVRKDGAVIAAFIFDRTRALVGHQTVTLDVAPMRRDGRVYVPLRVVAEAAGATVAYTSRPPVVHIHQPAAPTRNANATPASESRTAQTPSMAQWRLGVAVFTGFCCLGCLVLTARRFAPSVFRAAPLRGAIGAAHGVTAPAQEPHAPDMRVAPPDRIALTSVEAMGEARLHKELVTETRTIQVPVAREELVIEYAGEGGTVIVEGRQLAAGETVRIPLWEERIHVDVTKHIFRKEDIVVDKRRSTYSAPSAERGQPLDFGVGEGSPS